MEASADQLGDDGGQKRARRAASTKALKVIADAIVAEGKMEEVGKSEGAKKAKEEGVKKMEEKGGAAPKIARGKKKAVQDKESVPELVKKKASSSAGTGPKKGVLKDKGSATSKAKPKPKGKPKPKAKKKPKARKQWMWVPPLEDYRFGVFDAPDSPYNDPNIPASAFRDAAGAVTAREPPLHLMTSSQRKSYFKRVGKAMDEGRDPHTVPLVNRRGQGNATGSASGATIKTKKAAPTQPIAAPKSSFNEALIPFGYSMQAPAAPPPPNRQIASFHLVSLSILPKPGAPAASLATAPPKATTATTTKNEGSSASDAGVPHAVNSVVASIVSANSCKVSSALPKAQA